MQNMKVNKNRIADLSTSVYNSKLMNLDIYNHNSSDNHPANKSNKIPYEFRKLIYKNINLTEDLNQDNNTHDSVKIDERGDIDNIDLLESLYVTNMNSNNLHVLDEYKNTKDFDFNTNNTGFNTESQDTKKRLNDITDHIEDTENTVRNAKSPFNIKFDINCEDEEEDLQFQYIYKQINQPITEISSCNKINPLNNSLNDSQDFLNKLAINLKKGKSKLISNKNNKRNITSNYKSNYTNTTNNNYYTNCTETNDSTANEDFKKKLIKDRKEKMALKHELNNCKKSLKIKQEENEQNLKIICELDKQREKDREYLLKQEKEIMRLTQIIQNFNNSLLLSKTSSDSKKEEEIFDYLKKDSSK